MALALPPLPSAGLSEGPPGLASGCSGVSCAWSASPPVSLAVSCCPGAGVDSGFQSPQPSLSVVTGLICLGPGPVWVTSSLQHLSWGQAGVLTGLRGRSAGPDYTPRGQHPHPSSCWTPPSGPGPVPLASGTLPMRRSRRRFPSAFLPHLDRGESKLHSLPSRVVHPPHAPFTVRLAAAPLPAPAARTPPSAPCAFLLWTEHAGEPCLGRPCGSFRACLCGGCLNSVPSVAEWQFPGCRELCRAEHPGILFVPCFQVFWVSA